MNHVVQRDAGVKWSVVVLVMLLASACQDVPDRNPTGPVDQAFNQRQAALVQDSIAQEVEVSHFYAVLSGDAYVRKRDAVDTRVGMRGPVVVERKQSDEGLITIRFLMRDANRHRITVTLAHQPGQDGSPASYRTPYTFRQEAGHTPALKAEVREGRRRFRSHSGSLILTENDAGVMEGRLYFEMRDPGGSSEDWFELVGVFKASPDGRSASGE